jgi:multiple sugar transport system permease protein
MTARAATTPSESALVVRAVLSRLAFYLFVVIVSAFFALPLLWLVLAPFDRHPSLAVKVPSGTLQNFRDVFNDPNVVSSLKNSAILAVATMAIVVAAAALAAYALSRVRIP